MSKVKCFNLRFRARNFAGDTLMRTPMNAMDLQQQSPPYIDPRESIGFKEIDELVSAFIPSFPRNLRRPVNGGIVDVHLLLAFISPNV